MEYSKLIKTPYPPVDEAIREKDKAIEYTYYRYGKGTLYRAELIGKTLSITLYGRISGEGEIKALYRHFYDGEKYATQDLITGKKLTGMLKVYTGWYNRPDPVGEEDEKALSDFFGEKIYLPDIYSVSNDEEKLLKQEKLAKHKKECDRWSERNSVLNDPPPEVTEWIKNTVLKPYRFYFYSKDKKTGFCSECKHSFYRDIGHNKKLICPECGSELTSVSLKKRKHNSVHYEETVIYLDKVKEKNGKNAIVLRSFDVVLRFENFHGLPFEFEKVAYFYERYRRFYTTDFDYKKDSTDREYEYVYSSYKADALLDWRSAKKSSTGCLISDSYMYPGNAELLRSSLPDNRKNTDIAAIIDAIKCRPVELITAVKNMAALENLAKLGLNNLCYDFYDSLVYSWHYSTIRNKLGKSINAEASPCRLLKVSKPELSEMKKAGITLREYENYSELRAIRDISFSTFLELRKRKISERSTEITAIMKLHSMSYEKLIRYLDKQGGKRKLDKKDLLITFRDYLDLLKKLRLPINDSTVFTQHLIKEHDALSAIYFDSTKPEQNKKLMERAKILDTLSYDNGTYLIRPLKKASEFVYESTVLSHCVKTYIDRCAKGETNIYGVRRSDDPDTPYFTLTLNNTAVVVTNLGKRNCKPPKEIIAFVKEWEKKVIKKKKDEFLKAIAGKDKENAG